MEEIDLLQAIRVPFRSPGLYYVTGYDGFPAFGIGERADIKKPYRLSLPEKLSRDFSILVTVRADNTDNGFLFAVVNPADTLVQLGVRLSHPANGLQNISLYYSDVDMHVVSQVLTSFTVPSIIRQWTRFSLRIESDNVTLYMDCLYYESTLVDREPQELVFDSASTLYIGQAGPLLRGKFQVGVFWCFVEVLEIVTRSFAIVPGIVENKSVVTGR